MHSLLVFCKGNKKAARCTARETPPSLIFGSVGEPRKQPKPSALDQQPLNGRLPVVENTLELMSDQRQGRQAERAQG